MIERKVNLEEILFKHLSKAREMLPNENWYSDEEIKNSQEFVFFKDAMKEACQQTLELAAENAKAFDTIHSWNTPSIDAQSILNTIKQIE